MAALTPVGDNRYEPPGDGVLDARLGHADEPGRHIWVITAMWLLADPTTTRGVLLDRENLLQVQGPGCCKCEELYSPELAARPCSPEEEEREN